MLAYTLLGSNDLPRAIAFYNAVLAPLGAKIIMAFPKATVWGTDAPAFGVGTPYDGAPATSGNGTMIALMAPDRPSVDTVHAKALALGGKDEGAPGVRGDDPEGFYGAYFRDLDGNKLCVCHYGKA